MKKLLLTLLFVAPTLTFAFESCSISKPTFTINYLPSPIQNHYEYYSSQIRQISSSVNGHAFVARENPLGLYVPEIKFETKYNFKYFENENCGKINNFVLNIYFKSDIYIAKETQPLKCTYDRVLAHENKHYNYEKDGVESLLKTLAINLEKGFSSEFYGSNQTISQLIKVKSTNFSSDMKKFVTNNTMMKHELLDTDANYIKESSLCSQSENDILSKSLK